MPIKLPKILLGVASASLLVTSTLAADLTGTLKKVKDSGSISLSTNTGFFLNFPLFFLLLSTVLGIGFESKLLQAFCTNKIQF
jgi:hypothetical protein